jgi:colicin import membrane protein
VHALFVLLLVFGVSWQTERPAPVMVDLWETLPEVAPPAAVKPPRPPAEPAKVPEPAKDAPVHKAVVDEPPPPKTPDIALEKKKADTERLKKLKAMQVAEEKARAEAARAAQNS